MDDINYDTEINTSEKAVSALLAAAATGNVKETRRCLRQLDEIDTHNFTDSKGRTPLHIAIINHQWKIVDILLRHPIDEINKQFQQTKHDLRIQKHESKITTFGAERSLREEQCNEELHKARKLLERQKEKLLISQLSATNDEGENAIHILAAQNIKPLDFLLKKELGACVFQTSRTRSKTLFSSEESKAMRVERLQLLDMQNVNGSSALHVAASHGNVEFIKELIRAGVDKYSQDDTGKTPIEYAKHRVARHALSTLGEAIAYACKTGRSRETKYEYLVECGDNINSRSGPSLRSPLHVATEGGALKICKFLLNAGADVSLCDVQMFTSMHLAASGGSQEHIEIAEELFVAGADVNATSSLGHTPLHMAAVWAGSNEDNPSNTAGAMDAGDAMVTWIANNGGNLDAVDVEGFTPLLAAARHPDRHVAIAALLRAGANIYAQEPSRNWTGLHFACFDGYRATVRLLSRFDAEKGKLINMRDRRGKTATDVCELGSVRAALHNLFESAKNGDFPQVMKQLEAYDKQQKWIIQSKKDIYDSSATPIWRFCAPNERTSHMKRTPLMLAITGLHEALHPKRSDNIIRKRIRSSFQESKTIIMKRFSRVVKALLDDGRGDINAKDTMGRTATMLASKYSDTCILLKQLLHQGSGNINTTDACGNTSLHYALAYKNSAAIQLLEENNADDSIQNLSGKIPVDVSGMRHRIMHIDRESKDSDEGKDDEGEGKSDEDETKADSEEEKEEDDNEKESAKDETPNVSKNNEKIESNCDSDVSKNESGEENSDDDFEDDDD